MVKLTRTVTLSIFKTITYRIFGSVCTVLICLVLGLPIEISGLIGVIELVVKPIIYFTHELIWKKYVS
jgi:uncharacterized membrane protein